MLSTIFTLDKLRHLQALAGLVVLLGLLLFPLLQACSSSSPDNGSIVLDGREFNIVQYGEQGDSRAPDSIGSIEEMEKSGGFAFVFPSYLPEGMSNEMSLGATPPHSEGIFISSARDDSPSISISEDVCRNCLWAGLPPVVRDQPYRSIGGVDVYCSTAESNMDQFECNWKTNDKVFRVGFSWKIVWKMVDRMPTDEMKQEAMKVVESMILSPTHP